MKSCVFWRRTALLHTISEIRAIWIVERGVHSTAESRHGESPRRVGSRLVQSLVVTRVALQNITID